MQLLQTTFAQCVSSIFDYLKTGGGGGGGTGGDVEMTEKQKQGMQQIERNNEEIDELADVLSDGISGLKDLATAMGEELDMQAEMLEDGK